MGDAGAAGKLWSRGKAGDQELDPQIERFTVGRDPELDLKLVAFDALASMAHATMLAEIGVLAKDELPLLRAELTAIVQEAQAGTFCIARSEEDGHTAIENRLTQRLGEVGQRIHTGRSRNDQVIAALRLYGREAVITFSRRVMGVAARLLDLADAHRDVVVAGYTHTRQAMPTTMGHLFWAHAEGLLDAIPWLQAAVLQLDRSPLGSASGYGVALPLDRQRVAELLAFGAVQRNTLAVQNDRGKSEALVLAAVWGAIQPLARLAADVIWFSSEELGYLTLLPQTTTGSSIMPQKRNPDIWELVRATAAQLAARQHEVVGVVGTLSSGYHRDLQLTKEPFVVGLESAVQLATAVQPALAGLQVNAARCRQALQATTGATDAVYRRVAAGEAFRTVYRQVAQDPAAAQDADPTTSWRWRRHMGAPGAFEIGPARAALGDAQTWIDAQSDGYAAVWQTLLP